MSKKNHIKQCDLFRAQAAFYVTSNSAQAKGKAFKSYGSTAGGLLSLVSVSLIVLQLYF